jgi:hypothetical protein
MRFNDIVARLEATGHHEAAQIVQGMYVKQKRKPAKRNLYQPMTEELARATHLLYRATPLNMNEIATRLRVNPGAVSLVLKGKIHTRVARDFV